MIPAVPQTLKSIPAVRDALTNYDRAAQAAARAARALHEAECRTVPDELAPFDEAAASARLATARARDAVHGGSTEAETAAAIEAERAGHAKRSAECSRARAAAQQEVAAAREAASAADLVRHECGLHVLGLLREHAEQLLPELNGELVKRAADLYAFAAEIRAVAIAGDGSQTNRPEVYLEVSSPAAEHGGLFHLTSLGGREGGSRSRAAISFEGVRLA